MSAAQRSYRHEALLYRGVDSFLAGVVPFVRDGVARGEPVVVAVIEPRLSILRQSLAEVADLVLFIDMAQLGRNPAVIIPAWLDLVASHSAGGDIPIRGVGEPVWSGRTATEIAECQLHEALLNMAVPTDTPLWLLCPYDGGDLPPSVVADAHRTHPVLLEAGHYRGSTEYGGAFHIQELFQRCLPEPTGFTHTAPFSSTDVRHVEHWIKHAAQNSGIPLPRAAVLANAVQKLAADSVRFGGGHGVLRYWISDTTLVCDVTDHEVVTDPLVGRRPTLTADTHRPGLWSANRTCDLTQVRSNNAGTNVRIHTHLYPTGQSKLDFPLDRGGFLMPPRGCAGRLWSSPKTVEASAIRGSDARDQEEVRPGVP